MWRHCLLLALGGSAVFGEAADVTKPGSIEETSSNERKEDPSVESGVVSLHGKDFAEALQAHPLLMVSLIIIVSLSNQSKYHQDEEQQSCNDVSHCLCAVMMMFVMTEKFSF